MPLRRVLVPALVAAALLSAAALAQYNPLLGIPLVVAVGLGTLWLLTTYGAEL